MLDQMEREGKCYGIEPVKSSFLTLHCKVIGVTHIKGYFSYDSQENKGIVK